MSLLVAGVCWPEMGWEWAMLVWQFPLEARLKDTHYVILFVVVMIGPVLFVRPRSFLLPGPLQNCDPLKNCALILRWPLIKQSLPFQAELLVLWVIKLAHPS